MNILIAVLIFSLIVFIHELGHFLLAKANGIEVTEFSLGMGPRIFTWVKTERGMRFLLFAKTEKLEAEADFAGHTWYSIKCLPFGGSCMMLGEEEAVESDNAFNKKSVYARMSVIFAGPFFNFVLAFILALIIIGVAGYDPAKISSIEPGQPMEAAGFQEGDLITEINGKNIVLRREVSMYFQFNQLNGSPVEITVDREGQEITQTVVPEKVKQEDGTERLMLGFGYSSPREKVSAWGTIKYAAYEVKYWICTTIESLGQLISGQVSKDNIAGPVGIVKIVGDTVEGSKPMGMSMVLLSILNISILLTANLGVMNLLPIPALDGGRLLFLIIEWIRRKPLNQKFEGVVNFAGFMLLMLLMVLVMFNDIVKLF